MKKEFKEVQKINSIDPANPAERLCKLFEESGELAQVVNKSIGRKGKKVSDVSEIKDHVCEEAADTIQCVFSLIDAYDISYEELKNKLVQKNKKWKKVSEARSKHKTQK